MRKPLVVTARVRQTDPAAAKTDLLALGVPAGNRRLRGPLATLDRSHLGGRIAELIRLGDFTAEAGTQRLLDAAGQIAAKRILLLGLGNPQDLSLDTLRRAATKAATQALRVKARSLSLALPHALPRRLRPTEVGRALTEGAYFGAYRFDEFKTDTPDDAPPRLAVDLIARDTAALPALKRGLRTGSVVGQASHWARTVANRPGNVITPPTLASEARALARKAPALTCTVWDRRRIAEHGMGGLLAVGSGSASDPRFIVLRHRAQHAGRRPRVALVGKAVTFDSGGISIKPSADMDQMKFDKTGGVVVLAVLRAVADLKLDLDVLGVVPSAENLPGAQSYRPGDIITTYSGKTVEILNTDAEGRMILCDGIAWAARQKADIIIDIATLTGACMVALGKHRAGLFSSDDGLLRDLQRAAELSGEPVWHLPSDEDYAKDMKSKIADLKNCGPRWGGASTAAAFLRQFAGSAHWAHLDIAGMDNFTTPSPTGARLSTGFGVRLLTTYLRNLAEGPAG